jgi:hypothetical protein
MKTTSFRTVRGLTAASCAIIPLTGALAGWNGWTSISYNNTAFSNSGSIDGGTFAAAMTAPVPSAFSWDASVSVPYWYWTHSGHGDAGNSSNKLYEACVDELIVESLDGHQGYIEYDSDPYPYSQLMGAAEIQGVNSLGNNAAQAANSYYC